MEDTISLLRGTECENHRTVCGGGSRIHRAFAVDFGTNEVLNRKRTEYVYIYCHRLLAKQPSFDPRRGVPLQRRIGFRVVRIRGWVGRCRSVCHWSLTPRPELCERVVEEQRRVDQTVLRAQVVNNGRTVE